MFSSTPTGAISSGQLAGFQMQACALCVTFTRKKTYVVLHGQAAHRRGGQRLVAFYLLVSVLVMGHGGRFHHILLGIW